MDQLSLPLEAPIFRCSAPPPQVGETAGPVNEPSPANDAVSVPAPSLGAESFTAPDLTVTMLIQQGVSVLAAEPSTPERPYWRIVVECQPPCLASGKKGGGHRRNGVRVRLIRSVPRGKEPVIIEVREQRCRCGARPALPWIMPGAGMTREAFAYMQRAAFSETFAHTAASLAYSERQVRRRTLPTLAHVEAHWRPVAPAKLILDEVHLGEKGRKTKGRVVLLDGDAPAGRALIEIGYSDTKKELRRLLRAMPDRQRIRQVAMDGAQRYADVIREELGPDVAISYDWFHFRRDLDEVVVSVWREWYREFSGKRSHAYRSALLVDKTLLECPKGKLSASQQAALAALKQVAPHVEELYRWKEEVRRVKACFDPGKAETVFDAALLAAEAWLKRYPMHTSLALTTKVAKLIGRMRRRRADILNYMPLGRVVEGPRGVRRVGFGTNRAESHIRLVKALHLAANGLDPRVLRVKALVKHGAIDRATVDQFALAAPKLDAWPRMTQDQLRALERRRLSPRRHPLLEQPELPLLALGPTPAPAVCQ